MRMNNKGFTLIELLAVMIILVSISLVVVGNITASLTRRETKECEEQQALAVSAAKIYFSLNNTNSVKISALKSGNYFKDNNKIDQLKDTDTIKLVNNSYTYNGQEVGESCS